MVKEAMCSQKLCERLVDSGMSIDARTGIFGRVHYECSLAQAMRWLRDSKGIHIEFEWYEDNTWEYDIVSEYPLGIDDWDAQFKSYEEAAEDALFRITEKIGNAKTL